MNKAAEYGNKKVAVELTNRQWNTLTCYILMTTQHRKGEREAWQQLATEKDENGQPNFCKYRETSDVNAECDYIRNGAHECPLSKIYC